MQADGDGRTRVTPGGGGRDRPAGPATSRWRTTSIVSVGLAVAVLLAGAVYLFTDHGSGVAPPPGDNHATQNSQQATQSTSATPTSSPPASSPQTSSPPPSSPQAAPERQSAAPASPAPAAPPPAAAPKGQETTPPTGQAQTTPGDRAPPRATQQPMSQEPAALPGSDTKFVQASRANLRSAPRSRARVLGTVAKGAQVKVLGQSGRWVQIESDGRTGWVNAKLLGAHAAEQ